MKTGTVSWFDPAKGYGMIAPDDGSGDVFVSQRAIDQSGVEALAAGEAVTFRVATENGRPGAVGVALVGDH